MIKVRHTKVSSVPDAGNPTLVQPSDWNADHYVDDITIAEVIGLQAALDGKVNIGNAEPWTEQHYKYLEKNDEPIGVRAAPTDSIQFKIAENWLNIQTPITITAKRIEYVEN